VGAGTVDGMRNFHEDNPWPELDEPEFERLGLSLSLEQRAALAKAVDDQLRELTCDGTLRGAQRWAESSGVEWSRLQSELEANGGYCDCEVLLNVFGGDFDGLSGGEAFEPD
jgi:hypothetical protein